MTAGNQGTTGTRHEHSRGKSIQRSFCCLLLHVREIQWHSFVCRCVKDVSDLYLRYQYAFDLYGQTDEFFFLDWSVRLLIYKKPRLNNPCRSIVDPRFIQTLLVLRICAREWSKKSLSETISSKAELFLACSYSLGSDLNSHSIKNSIWSNLLWKRA